MIPDISDIPNKYGNLVLMSSLPVLHKDNIKTSLSQQINKLLLCNEYVNLSSWETVQISIKRVRENKTWFNKIQPA